MEKGAILMQIKQNLHTHTTWCDGINAPEEMIRYAMERGFTSLGFSGHSPNKRSNYAHVTEESTAQYKQEILALKEKYRDQFPIYLGLEVEATAECCMDGYDFLIGSLHYMSVEDQWFGFDRSAETVRDLIDRYFAGDGMAFALQYFRDVAKLPDYGKFDIIGHFDIHTKNNEILRFVDTEDPAYLRAAIEAIEALQGKIPLFEVNTGDVARGYKSVPYPEVPLLKEFKRLGFGAVISSDCHDMRYLDYGFDQAHMLLKQCGFRETYVLTDSGFVPVEL
jgi:histidinol-phosphatase (PHP family)